MGRLPLEAEVGAIGGQQLTYTVQPWTQSSILKYTYGTVGFVLLQYFIAHSPLVTQALGTEPAFQGWYGIDVEDDMTRVFMVAAVLAASIYLVYLFFCFMQKRDPVDEQGRELTVYDPGYMSVELAPWMSGLCALTVVSFFGSNQTASTKRKVSGVLYPAHFYKEAGEFDETKYMTYIAYIMMPITVLILIHVANLGRMRYFLPPTMGAVVRPFYLLAMYCISLIYADSENALSRTEPERAKSITKVLNGMWIFYWAVPLVLGLLNVYVFKVQWEVARSEKYKNLLKFVVIPAAFNGLVGAFLTWGVQRRFDAVILGVPCAEAAAEGNEWPSGPLAKDECSWYPRDNFQAFLELTRLLKEPALQGGQEPFLFVLWLLSSFPCFNFLNHSFFPIYAIAGMSQVRFNFTELWGIPFAMRAAYLLYEPKTWFIGTPTCTIWSDLLAFFGVFSLCRSCRPTTSDPEKFITLPISVFKARLFFATTFFGFFSAIFVFDPSSWVATQYRSSAAYAMSAPQAFMYIVSAMAMYHAWDFGFLRTAACLMAREHAREQGIYTTLTGGIGMET